ncbi:MAG: flagellar biosynthesis protein FliQ [Armatimonadetes bacterium]|jgi:flagellar biosynthetic protein FliQ|nr:flagellar biosynthesis protein FliQ [Armatimonadota bacterium]
MTDSGVLELAQRSVMLALTLAAPVLGFGLVVGLLVSVFQAATQIQEMTLSFVPKILAATAALVLFGPWMLRSLVTFTTKLFVTIPNLAR